MPHSHRIFDERLREHLLRQATSRAVTDCDRLDAAFAELEQQGIIAQQCWGDDYAIPEWQAARRDVRRVVFNDEQMTAVAVQTGELDIICGLITSSRSGPCLARRPDHAASGTSGRRCGAWRP